MCMTCDVLLQWINKENCGYNQQLKNYKGALNILKEMVADNRVEFVAGNCSLENIKEDELECDGIFEPNHFFRCLKCRKNFQLSVNRMGLGIHVVDDGVPNIDFRAFHGYWKGVKKKFGTWTKTRL